MKAKVLASTKVGYKIPTEEAMVFSGHEAGICYMPDDADTLFAEPEGKALKRANGTLVSGHHSVFGHVYYNFVFEEIPKILAMILNNEKVYNTSEKSARYTKMKPSPEEETLYLKWIDKFKEVILENYPDMDEKQATKLAQENARYLISVFTPATTMGYSVDLRQLNYLLGWMADFIQDASNEDNFNVKLKEVFAEFILLMKSFKIPGLKCARRHEFSFFAKRKRDQEFGENYCINYKGTFSQLAQAHRHRTIKYEMSFDPEPKFFVPFIIRGTDLETEWLNDIESLKKYYPQGMLININERGSVEDFVLKCKERCCGCAQLEIARQTRDSMRIYLAETKDTKPAVYAYLSKYGDVARCMYPDYQCPKPCIWGPKNAFDRKV